MTRFYVTHGTTRRSLRSGAEFAAARGAVRLANTGVKLNRDDCPATAADTHAVVQAMEKRARKAAKRLGWSEPA